MGRIYVSTGEKALLLEGARWAQEGRPLYSIPGEYEYLETVRSSVCMQAHRLAAGRHGRERVRILSWNVLQRRMIRQ